MNTLTKLLAGASIGALMIGSASASDLNGRSLKDGPIDSDVERAWTGFIIGGMFGGTFNSSKIDFNGQILDCPPIDLGASANGLSTVGIHAGGVIGYQRQLGLWVAGVEGWGGWSNADTEISIEIDGPGNHFDMAGKASVKQDYWYAGYAKLGRDIGGGVLASGLLGYKQVHLKGGDALDGWDADVGGVSGGLLLEKKFWRNLNVGAYATYTGFEKKNFDGIAVDMDGYDVGLRATLQF